jgi:acyl-CoA reductase-like NAD-dependent aldehyde dehydrogenase
VGDPFDLTTDLGPLVSNTHRDRVEGYVAVALDEGARVATGGGRPSDQPTGWFVEPTVLVKATNDMRSSREEIFGPVVSVIPYKDERDAVRLANDSRFGLSSGIFTRDAERGHTLASELRAGTVGINTVGTNIAFPFGGFKESGFGRQHGPESVAEFTETKTVALPKVMDEGSVA